jgi:putative hemolysin
MSTWVSALIVLFFILVGGFFAAAEIALVSLREAQVKRIAETKGRRGKLLKELHDHPNRFLASVQVGVTVAGFIGAGFGASSLTPVLSPVLDLIFPKSVVSVIAFILITLFIAYFSLVLGELVPKRLALQNSESWALVAAYPIDILARISRPFIWLLSHSTNLIVRLLGGDPSASRQELSGEDLRDLVAGHEELSENERALIDDVFEADDREIKEVMTPRTEVEFLDAESTIPDAALVVEKLPHTKYPVINKTADEVVGFVHVRQLLSLEARKSSKQLREIAIAVESIPGTTSVLSALAQMRKGNQHLLIVADEYGGTAGIVTLDDLVEELIGDIRHEDDEPESEVSELDFHGEVEVDGLMNLDDFADSTHIHLPEGPYETVAGFVIAKLGTLPAVGKSVIAEQCVFEILSMDVRRISRVRVSRIEPGTSNHGGQ